MESRFVDLLDDELCELNGGFTVIFTIAVCVEVFVGTAAGVALYKENKRLDNELN